MNSVMNFRRFSTSCPRSTGENTYCTLTGNDFFISMSATQPDIICICLFECLYLFHMMSVY